MSDKTIEQLDPKPTLEDIAELRYPADSTTFYRCGDCGAMTVLTGGGKADIVHGTNDECDGKYREVSRASVLDTDQELQDALADAQRAWAEARGLELPDTE